MRPFLLRPLVLAAIAMSASSAVEAAGLDAIQGAWTLSGTCSETFKKVGSKMRFRDRSSNLSTGVIIDGKKIEGSNMSCTAAKVRETGKGDYTIMMNCASALMFDTVSTGFRVISADEFERFNPGFPEMTFNYRRCKL
jgi:hypothetical protein